jgi:hypothetical protein
VSELLPGGSRDFAMSSGDFEEREMLFAGYRGDALDEGASGGDSSEPAVDAVQIAQRSLDFMRRAVGGVEEFGGYGAAHSG